MGASRGRRGGDGDVEGSRGGHEEGEGAVGRLTLCALFVVFTSIVEVSVVAMLPRVLRKFFGRSVLTHTRGGNLTRVRLRGLHSCALSG